MTLITLTDVHKAYAGVPALVGASLEVAPGEIHALMGENGAGKSTLIKVLAGVVRPERARIEIEGRPAVIDTPAAAHALGLRFIHQELDVVPWLSVAENIHLGRPYPRRAGPFVDWKRLDLAASDALERLGIGHIDPKTKMGRLGFADQMLVRISAALLEETGAPARLYVMDEPTAALNAAETERLFAVLEEIRRGGGSVLYVSHRLDEVMRLCDRVTVMRDGRTVASEPVAAIGPGELVRLMTGRRLEEGYPPRGRPPDREVAISIASLRARGVAPFTLSVLKGEVVGLAGLSGAGQNAVLRALIGDGGSAGAIRIGGRRARIAGPAGAWAAGLAYVPRERRSEGLVVTRSIMENVTLPHLARLSRGGTLLARARETARAVALSARVRLKAVGPHQSCRELSGGNQQKVVFAKALAGAPEVLLLDEPTRGVDVAAKFDIYTLIREMTAKGMAVLITSSDLPELIGICDRILVMRSGAVTAELDAAGLSEEDLLNHCYGRVPTGCEPAAAEV